MDIQELDFTEAARGPVRGGIAEEPWEETQRVAGRRPRPPKPSHGRWLVTREWDAFPAQVIWRIGHRRWGVENQAFNELTQHYHLTHCPHHHPVAIVAGLLIQVRAFNLFEFLAWFKCG